jgi:FAD/FMN-containing dehydrogenase
VTRVSLSGEIGAIVGHDHVLTDPADTAPFTEDWTGRWRGHTPCVALPQRVAELEQVIGLLARRGIAYVPQGGHTGLVGGGTPLDGGVVVSTRQLTGLLHLDVEAREVVVRAGTTLAELNAAVARAGLELPIDFASRDRATGGGMVATDAA